MDTEVAVAADVLIYAVPLGPLNHELRPYISIGEEDHIRIVDLHQLHEIGEHSPLRALQSSFSSAVDLDAGDLFGAAADGVALHLDLQAAQRNIEVRGEPGLVHLTAGEHVPLCHVLLVAPDVHVVEIRCVACLLFDLLGHASVATDLVAVQRAEDGIKAALLSLVTALQGLDHVNVGMRVFEVEVEELGISDALLVEASLPCPQLHARLCSRSRRSTRCSLLSKLASP